MFQSHTRGKPPSRWKAAGIHLLLSALTALGAAILIFGIWFPPPYFKASGGDRLIALLIGIDLVAGPLLTLVIFKAGKRGLKFDLACIGIVQLAALVYGLSIITESRPAFIVATIDRFEVVPANAFEAGELQQAPDPALRRLPWTGPVMIAALMPDDVHERSLVLASAMRGKDLDRLPKYYATLDKGLPLLSRNVRPLDALIARDPANNRPVVDAAIARRGLDPANVGWVPISAPRVDITMLVDRATAKPIVAIDVAPWDE